MILISSYNITLSILTAYIFQYYIILNMSIIFHECCKSSGFLETSENRNFFIKFDIVLTFLLAVSTHLAFFIIYGS